MTFFDRVSSVSLLSVFNKKNHAKRLFSGLAGVAVLFLLLAVPALALDWYPESGSAIDWGPVLLGLFGGIAFFLYGMELMSEGMKRVAGSRMREGLASLTRSPFRALGVGAFVTMMVQSSSATSVMLVGLVQSELMRFPQTLGVILGSGIGSTVTAQLIAFKVTDYALIMVGLGFLLKLLGRGDRARDFGRILLGFGVLFYGMKLMSDAMVPLRSDPGTIAFLQSLSNPVLGILAGIVVTALIQSSGAIVGILIVLGEQGLVGLDAAVPIILGSNIGTCVTAILAGLAGGREAKRVAAAHAVFKIAGVLVCLPFLAGFGLLVEAAGGGMARQVANIHTFFNVGLALIFLPFTAFFARFIEWTVPEKKEKELLPAFTSPLENAKIVSPDVAVEMARHEIARMAGLLEVMVRDAGILFVAKKPRQDSEYPRLSLLEGLAFRERELDYLDKVTGDFLFRIGREAVTGTQTQTIYAMISITRDLESIGDLMERNVVPLLEKKQALLKSFSDEGREELEIYHTKVLKQLRLLREAFSEKDLDKATKIMRGERKYLDLELQYRIRHLNRIMCQRVESVETHELHMELMNLMTQVIVYTSNIAKTYLSAVAERDV
ncbi:phosphate:Na+ symporter [Desulfobotulus alkaliphilus]|uniref:Phosphate:Na+ symporter n=1 Tax=Desulfobotulus alkaliphilus TaxID=622671 RepID=A0A562S6M9_9BACT|nr:Na/Pi cotransporter family protein [Desulfobotulus alkaliphilus]TWI76858.1 phosphate:Na+ symporter [Desulfobotulus alkaliphilus]